MMRLAAEFFFAVFYLCTFIIWPHLALKAANKWRAIVTAAWGMIAILVGSFVVPRAVSGDLDAVLCGDVHTSMLWEALWAAGILHCLLLLEPAWYLATNQPVKPFLVIHHALAAIVSCRLMTSHHPVATVYVFFNSASHAASGSSIYSVAVITSSSLKLLATLLVDRTACRFGTDQSNEKVLFIVAHGVTLCYHLLRRWVPTASGKRKQQHVQGSTNAVFDFPVPKRVNVTFVPADRDYGDLAQRAATSFTKWCQQYNCCVVSEDLRRKTVTVAVVVRGARELPQSLRGVDLVAHVADCAAPADGALWIKTLNEAVLEADAMTIRSFTTLLKFASQAEGQSRSVVTPRT